MPPSNNRPARPEPGFAEFVTLIALMMALTALSIDIMLVALPDIGRSFALTDPNQRQYVITAYLIGFAAGQPFYGPLSDRFGRKPVLYAGTGLFIAGAVAAVLAPDFLVMLLARGLQGFGAAAARVIGNAIVRDRFAGRGMSRVMSFVMMVFIIVPIVAPSIGSAILTFAEWRWLFLALGFVGILVIGWTASRLPETLRPEDRMALSWTALAAALRLLVNTRQTLGYTIAAGFQFGLLMSYIASAEQVFVDTYDLGADFPFVFGAVASVMIVAGLTNARLVERIGMRRLSHMALMLLLIGCAVAAFAGFPTRPPLAAFCAFLALVFFCFGVIMPNFNAMAMEPLGRVAGTGSSFIGFFTTAAGAVLGALIGQEFDGTVRPLMIGITILACLTLLSVLITERWRLFQIQALPR